MAGLCGAEEAWQDAAPPPPRPGTVTEARRVVAALADVPEAQVDAAMDAAQRRCPRWGRAVALVKRRRFAEAVPLFRAALVAQNAGLAALLGPEEVLRPWVEHYALVLLGIEGLGPVLPLGAAAAEEGLPGPPRVALRAVQLRDAAYEELKVRYVRAPWSTGPCGAGGGALGPEAHGNAGVTAFRGPGLWGRGGGDLRAPEMGLSVWGSVQKWMFAPRQWIWGLGVWVVWPEERGGGGVGYITPPPRPRPPGDKHMASDALEGGGGNPPAYAQPLSP